MIEFSSLDCAVQRCREGEGTVFAWEKDTFRHRKFFYVDTEESLRRLFKDRPRRFHEIILPDRPMRFYVDLDAKNISKDEWTRRVEDVDQRVRDYFRAKHARETRPRLLRADRPAKWSVHLIYDVWLRDSDACLAVARALACEHLDMQVYTDRRRPKSLRTPYSHSFDENNALVPDQGPKEYDFAALIQGLVAWGEPADVLDVVAPLASPAQTEDAPECDDPELLQAVERVREWVGARYGVRRFVDAKRLDARGEWEFVCYPGVFCRVKGAKHARQNCYFYGKIKPGRRLECGFLCPDVDCRVRVPVPDLTDLAFNKRRKLA